MLYSSALFSLIGSTFALTAPPPGALTVGGSEGKYSTVQAAVNALQNTTTRQNIFIYPGAYEEQVFVPKYLGPVTIYGYSENESSYEGNTVTLSFGLSQAFNLSNDLTGTLRAHAADFSLYNVNVENTYGRGSQAVAVSAYGTEQGYYGCKLTGFQDTLLTQRGKHFFVNTYIEGATDFIFGQYSAAWFENCDLRVPAAKIGYVTASGRNTTNDGWYVINGGSVEAAPGQNVTAGAFYLGRPWRDYARVVFQNVYLSEVINSDGWTIWSTTSKNTDHVTFAEFNNTGPGAGNGTRVDFAEKLDAPIDITEVLGSNYTAWIDPKFL